MISSLAVPPVVPAGQMAQSEQPVLHLPSGLELRPWRLSDADVLGAAGQDAAIRQWSRLLVESPEDGRKRVERMRQRWRAELSAIWAIARPGGAGAMGLIGWGDIDLTGGSAAIVYSVLPA